ncbi:MAG: hypothetical protein OSB67_02710 [Alphaproteobacteria bacterium]|nr:hypothetical protein [Alphaproteobacteria bacterium]
MGLKLVMAVLPLMATLIGAPQAFAQQQAISGFDVPVCKGNISTFVLNSIPSDQLYWFDIFDKTDEALAFREIFLKTLKSDGRKTNKQGRLVFNFEWEAAFLGFSARGGVDKDQGSGVRDHGSSSDIGLNELRDTIRESGSDRRNRSSLGRSVDARAELRDSQTGRVIWLATLSCQPLTGDRKLLMRFISKVVVDSLGREGGNSSF